jgi:serine/threonine protein phosphatase PrpC
MAQTDTDPELVLPPPPPSGRLGLTVRSFGLTDRGQVRPSNEDHFLIAGLSRVLHVSQTSLRQAEPQYSSRRGHVFIVADGMGGHAAGEVASALSVVSIEGFLLNTLRRFFNIRGAEEQTVLQEFEAALKEADARLFEEADLHPELMGMGTTLTMAFVVRQALFVAHAGDSRCYLYSAGRLQQLTQDHTMAAEMVRMGILSPEEAKKYHYRNVVTNVLGGREPGVRVEMHKLGLEPGDVILVCSDGLSGMVPDEQIAAVLAAEREPEGACRRLVAEANAQGGKDNITVIVAHCELA